MELNTIGSSPFQDLESKREDTSIGVFGEAKWQFAHSWNAILGARYNWDDTDTYFYNRKEQTITESEYSSSAFLPKLGIVYDLTKASSLGFTISQGYRPGFTEEDRQIDPEYLTNYELAYRSEWFNRDLQANANLFYYDWQDMQVSVPVGNSGVTYTENAGKASVYGVELELRYKISGTTFGGSLGYLRTSLDDYKSSVVDIDFTGNEFPEAPEFSGSLWIISRFGEHWFTSADLIARSEAFATSDLANVESRKIPAYEVLDVRIGYEQDYYSIIFAVDNVFDKEYLTGRDLFNGYYVGDPRTYSVQVSAFY